MKTKNLLKNISLFIFNNNFIPLKISKVRNSHVVIVIVLFILIFIKLMFEPVEMSEQDLIDQVRNHSESSNTDIYNEISANKFNERSLLIWENLQYYYHFQEMLSKYTFDIHIPKIPTPKYPLISVLLSSFTDSQLFYPTNLVDIAKALRKALGSGITIRSEALIYDTLTFKNNESKNQISDEINAYKKKIDYISSITISGKKSGQVFSKNYVIDYNIIKFPNFENLIEQGELKDISIDKVELYKNDSKILKSKYNSREFLDYGAVPDKVKKAYILMEDDYFYFEPFGINLPRILKATYYYFTEDSQKGNPTLAEQFYEFYVGKKKKNAFDKFVQIIGAMYYTYYNKNREEILDLYVQSIPGSFWGDHNYGVKAVMTNYLRKNNFDELEDKELAWMSRVGLLPTVVGKDSVMFYFLKSWYDERKIDIWNNVSLSEYINDKSKNSNDALHRFLDKEYVNRLKESHNYISKEIDYALDKFRKGNLFVNPIISNDDYEKSLTQQISYKIPPTTNIFQSYTDHTRKDIGRIFGDWAWNSGLDVTVAFDEAVQLSTDKAIKRSCSNLGPKYGGAGILVKTNNLKDGKADNKIVAIASKHTDENSYFNWAVDGFRHFGSIIKWITLALYLDSGGTILDTFYDIPREFIVKDPATGEIITSYTPDNWKSNYDDEYGFFTFEQHDNIYNFLQSKNNTFVHIADRVGVERLADFLNEMAELLNLPEDSVYRFKPNLIIALGAQEICNAKFAQIASIIANNGIFKPITTITKIKGYDGKYYRIDLPERQVISPEAAQCAFFCGYLNPYYGTAKRFLQGGVGKTGSAKTDVGFLAMTAKTKDQYISEQPDNINNWNLLYLVNVGVNKGLAAEWLYGSNIGAPNATEVFNFFLEYQPDNKNNKYKYPIGGEFTKEYSPNLEFIKYTNVPPINGKVVQIPFPKGKTIYHEPYISVAAKEEIQARYTYRKDVENLKKELLEYARANRVSYRALLKEYSVEDLLSPEKIKLATEYYKSNIGDFSTTSKKRRSADEFDNKREKPTSLLGSFGSPEEKAQFLKNMDSENQEDGNTDAGNTDDTAVDENSTTKSKKGKADVNAENDDNKPDKTDYYEMLPRNKEVDKIDTPDSIKNINP